MVFFKGKDTCPKFNTTESRRLIFFWLVSRNLIMLCLFLKFLVVFEPACLCVMLYLYVITVWYHTQGTDTPPAQLANTTPVSRVTWFGELDHSFAFDRLNDAIGPVRVVCQNSFTIAQKNLVHRTWWYGTFFNIHNLSRVDMIAFAVGVLYTYHWHCS